MGISRLDNFLKSVRGNTLYVDPNSLDSTDSVENQGNSPTRPFKTIQRALIEAARFSYQVGSNNDRFNKTTIILQPGEHIVDNRPGVIVNDDGSYRTRDGVNPYTDYDEFDLNTNFNISSNNNILYKLNSIYGGVIVPRGTSIVGSDIRKTVIRPKYIPNPENTNIERSAIFRVTGGCFLYGFSILDADPNGTCYKDYTLSEFVPNFSHHKLTAFEYADGVNLVEIDDDFISNFESSKTDLEMYYDKISVAYGQNSGREIISSRNDIQPVVDEYRIVGSRGEEVEISSISASGTTVTVTLSEALEELSANSPIQISGVNSSNIGDIYDGQYVISSVISNTQFTYTSIVTNVDTSPNVGSATLSFSVDTVTSASPYIFNVSLRSVYGMCGMHADGSKASGFKSMVVAQFTGIGLQKDDNAFVKYNSATGEYDRFPNVTNIHSDSFALFKPEYQNYHVKASNNAFIQLVSIFAIGYAEHFVVESGGDQSITNSNSNFGAKSLVARGFRDESFPKDDLGYITHIVSPQKINSTEISVEFSAIDVGLTTSASSGAGTTTKLYLYNENNEDNPPNVVIDGFRIGAKDGEILYTQISQSGVTSTYSCRVTMPESDLSKEKVYTVARENNDTENSISATGVITLETNHEFIAGEKVRVFSDNGHLPDGLSNNKIYYVIDSTIDTGIGSTEIKLAATFGNAFTDTPIIPNKTGGIVRIKSRVSDKVVGDIGHPVQYDSGIGNWYINVSSTDNTIYNIINNVGISGLGEATPRTYIKRINDNRNLVDSIYKFRYVIPKDSSTLARPPLDGFIIQESNSSGLTDAEQDYYYSLESSPVTLSNSTQVRNPGFISNAEWSSNVATIYTELPHNLSVGSEVRISNVTSGLNTTTDQEKGYNGVFTVTSIPSSKEFAYSLVDDPGSFQNDTTIRDLNLPTYSQKTLPINYQIYRSIEIQPYIQNKQDGIYQLIVINNSNRPNIDPFQNVSLSQPVQYLYPQLNRDNPSADPDSSKSFALYNPIGQVVINDPENSLTKETVEKTINDLKIGFGVTSIISSSGTAHTIFTEIDHGLSGITSVSIVSSGSDYLGAANYYAAELVGFAGSTTGSGANARISIDGSGQLSEIVIMDPGSVYGIGNTLQVIPAAGIGTTTGFIPAVIQVESIANDIGTIIEISGLSAQHTNYNNLYKVVGFTSTSNEIVVSSASSVSGFSTTILELGENTSVYTGKVLTVSGVTYNNETGVGIVTFTDSHGLNVDNSILFTGFDENFLNKTAYVSRNRSLLSVDVDFGISETSLSTSGTVEGYIRGYSDRSGNLSRDNDITSGRNIIQYGGIQSKILTQLLSNSTAPNELEILDAYSLGFRLGDYLQVDKELFRIKSTVDPTSNTVEVFRSILGSPRQSHDANSVVKKIKVVPVEFRRNSIIRASGHTFEYLGYGPGNYSTAFPERQDRVLSPQEELIAQSTKENGGIVIFTAMNSDGDFYTGNKKVNSATGKEEVFDTPVPTVTGEEIDVGSFSVGFDVISPLEISVSRSLRVEGGPDGNLVSEFDGPVVFTNKLTSTSDKGIEATSLFLQGDAEVSRNLTVGISTPTSAGNYGDVVTRTEPILGENLGWVYTSDNEWKQWGLIKNIGDPLYGVGISSGGGSVGFSTLIDFVGVGVTVTVGFNTETNKSTVTVSGDPANTIGISSGGSYLGDSASLDFVGASDGFGLNLSVQYGGILGITTIVFDVPIDDIDFGTGILGKNPPTFISTSTGTRVIYENTIDTTNTNYAVGVDGTSLWWSVPQNSAYSFQWYGGTTKVGELVSQSGSGQLTINGSSSKVTAKQLVSDVSTGTAPLLVTSSTQVNNLNANYLQGFISSENELENTIVRRNSSNVIQGNVTKLIHSGIGQTGGWYADIPARLGYTPFNDAGDTCTGPAIFNSTLTANGLTTIKQVSDIYKQQSTSSTIITCDFSTGPITRTESTDTTEVNIINVPTTTERALNYTVLMNTKGISVSELSNIVFKINGTALTPGTNLYWLNDLSPVGTSPGYYFFGFTILRIGSNWEVLGTFAPYGN